MMAQPDTGQDTFAKHFADTFATLSLDDPLNKARAKAWDQFQELGLPGAKSEVFRYLKMKQLYNRSFSLPPEAGNYNGEGIYPECRNSTLVFINGKFRADLSNVKGLPDKVVILPLEKAVRTYGTLLNNAWGKSIREEVDPFAALNLALHQNGLFIYVPPKTVLNTPLEIVYAIDCGNESAALMPRIQLFVGTHSEMKIVTTLKTFSGKNCWVNQVIEMALDDGARVHMTQMSEGIQEDIWAFDALRATLKRDSSLTVVEATEGSATIRHDYKVQLNGENGEALLNGVWMLKERKEAHVHVLMDHQAPNCRSMQLFKGVLNDLSRSSFEGKIMVRQEAQKTQAFQLNNNLLLSDRANADSKPNLEIFADDVKASHGATVGQVDAEQLFYMKTRGYSENEAKNLLVYGFCHEVLGMIPVVSVLDDAAKRAKSVLSN